MPPFSPQWNAFTREAAIASQSISSGLTTLRKAYYSSTGLYSHAFFSLAIGFERLLKIIVIIDYAVRHSGALMPERMLRKYGHDIGLLFADARLARARTASRSDIFDLPANGIEADIIRFLTKFSKSTRYYNLDYLSGVAVTVDDPIREWFDSIGSRIFEAHYKPSDQRRDRARAEIVDALIGSHSAVFHTAEDGSALTTVSSASFRTAQNKVLQKYGTFYCAKIARYLYILLHDLEKPGHQVGLDVAGLHELFFIFLEDRYLLSRKTFPPRGQ
ncbi:hypothetical protein [Reyranella sp.]|uniref:hypothetical protein n=1 Tax=Reyranella sp. TaxID=1929291 RepID=UPI003D0C1EEA